MRMIKTQFLFLSFTLKTSLGEVHPNVFIALRIMLNCPDTGASSERSFRKLKLTKQVSYSRLSSLAMLSIEASYVRCLDLDDVIKAFPCKKTRSKPF